MVSVVGSGVGVDVIGVAYPVRLAGYGSRFRSFMPRAQPACSLGLVCAALPNPLDCRACTVFCIFHSPEVVDQKKLK
jgi:hypothetical protein